MYRRYSKEFSSEEAVEESKTPVAVKSKEVDPDDQVADEEPFMYIEDTEWWNSWESGKDFEKLENYKFDTEEFVKNSRSSTLLY